MSDVLVHHGILGQKWGIRRYQNPDGSLTTAGKQRYGIGKAISNLASKIKASIYGDGSSVPGRINMSPRDYLTRFDEECRVYSKAKNIPLKEVKRAVTQDDMDLNIANGIYEKLSSKGFGDVKRISVEVSHNAGTDWKVSAYTICYNGKPITSMGADGHHRFDLSAKGIEDAVDDFAESLWNVKWLGDDAKERLEKNSGTAYPVKYRIAQVKNLVNDVLFKANRKMKDILHGASRAIENGKKAVSNVLSKAKDLFKKALNIQEESTTKQLTQRELDDYYVKKAFGVKT